MKKQNVRTLSLIVCFFTYLLVGAAIFDAWEAEYEMNERSKNDKVEKEFLLTYNVTRKEFNLIRATVIRHKPHNAGIQWKFSGAFYFALTVITSIGYGHSAPRTNEGRIFCMFYSLVGIPLWLVTFQSIGERLNVVITFILRNIKKCFKLKNTEVSQTNLIIVGTTLVIIVHLCGAAVFSSYEGWDYMNALYYCFITLTTIGFGDFVALQKPGDLQRKPEYVAFSIIFILFGLAVFAAALNLLVLRFMTMNTEDERREEMEAIAAARGAVHLDGDIITPNGGNEITRITQDHAVTEDDDLQSVCSCSCYNFRNRGKHRYSVTRTSGKVDHLLQMQTMNSNSHSRKSEIYTTTGDDTNSLLHFQSHRKRASI